MICRCRFWGHTFFYDYLSQRKGPAKFSLQKQTSGRRIAICPSYFLHTYEPLKLLSQSNTRRLGGVIGNAADFSCSETYSVLFVASSNPRGPPHFFSFFLLNFHQNVNQNVKQNLCIPNILIYFRYGHVK